MMNELIAKFQSYGDSEFLLGPGFRYTYRDLTSRTAADITFLSKKGIGSGDIVLLEGDVNLPSISMLCALAASGCVVAPLTSTSREKLASALEQLKPGFLIKTGNQRETAIETLFERGLSPVSSCFPEPVPGLMVFTSGSTGAAKGIVHDFNPLLAKFLKPRKPHRAIPFLLFDHMGGINTILSLASSGGCIISTSGRSVTDICAAVEAHQVTLLPTTPTFLNLMLISEEYKRFDLSSLRVVSYGTEIMSEAVLKRLVQTFPQVDFKQTYGLSEVGVLPTLSRSPDTTWLKVDGPGVETKIDNGILWLKVPSRMLGHFEFSKDQAPQWKPQTEGWFSTGDQVLQDGEYIKFVGRDSDIINVSGLKVFPSEVENCLLGCSVVQDAAVVGEKNLLTGKMVSAFIVLRQDADPATAKAAIEKHCRERLQKFQVPAKLRFVDTLPVSDRFKRARGELCIQPA